MLLETAHADKSDTSKVALEQRGVGESEVLSSEAWMARAEAHRDRCGCLALELGATQGRNTRKMHHYDAR